MSQFSKLIDEVADRKNNTLSEVLMKAKVFANRIHSRKFRLWIDSELDGYELGQSLPKYRIIGATIEGYFAGYFGAYQIAPISTSHIEIDLQKAFNTASMTSSVSYIEDLATSEDGVGVWLDGYYVNYLREHGTRISNMILNRVLKRVSRHSLVALLSAVRSRLLDFLLELRDRYPKLEKNDNATAAVNESEVDAAFEKRVYQNCTVIEGSEMRDSFQAGQAGATGPNAQAENMNFIQILRESIGDSNLADLVAELEELRLAMLAESNTADQDAAVAAIANAEAAAKKGDAKGVLGFLKQAGKWALDVATKIGTAVAGKAIEKSLGY